MQAVTMVEIQSLSFRKKLSWLIEECKSMRELKQIHTHILKSPHLHIKHQYFLVSRLLFFCAISDSGSLRYAIRVFYGVKHPCLSLYNIMIRASATKTDDSCQTHLCRPLDLYKQMLCNGIFPNCLTFTFLVKDCTRRLDYATGPGIHAQVIKFGFCDDIFVQNSMIGLYSACGLLSNAWNVFDEMLIRDVVTWNSMITGCLRAGELDRALDLFRRMKRRNNITWNSIITGFVQGGRAKEALELFHEMQILTDDIIRPDKITMASVLSACAYLGAIDHGKWVHGYLRRSGLVCDMVIGTALVDMYGKCGRVDRAIEVFNEMPEKDAMAWTAMISTFAKNGFGKETLDCFEEMEIAGVKPNNVTFVALLSACAHSGLVEKGRWCFEMMKCVYSVEPQVHHYACMVDILSRAGLFEEAKSLITGMPMKPDVYVWGALLGGCQMHGKIDLGERVAHYLINLEPYNHAFYVNLIDIYAKSGRFEDAKRIRTLMQERGIKKEIPGCSMIEVNGVVHEFSVRGSGDFLMEDIVEILNELYYEMRGNFMEDEHN